METARYGTVDRVGEAARVERGRQEAGRLLRLLESVYIGGVCCPVDFEL